MVQSRPARVGLHEEFFDLAAQFLIGAACCGEKIVSFVLGPLPGRVIQALDLAPSLWRHRYFRMSLSCACAIIESASCRSSRPSVTSVLAAAVTARTYPSCEP